MKTIIMMLTGTLLATGVLYGYERLVVREEMTGTVLGESPDMYCAKMKDGQIVVIFQGKEITADVFLANGTTVKRDGTLIKKDGTRSNLKEGECIDVNGKMGDVSKEPY